MTKADFTVRSSPEAIAEWFGFASVAELEASHEQYAAEMTKAAADEAEPEAEEGRVMSEPGTNEWAYETGNYVDPEPDWDAGSPYVDHAHGVVFYDDASEVDAGRARWPEYRHVDPEPEREPLSETEPEM